MDTAQLGAAVGAAKALAAGAGLTAEGGVVLSNSNRAMVRLLPCDAVARLAPGTFGPSAQFEVDVALRLAGAGCAVAAPDPRIEARVYERDAFAITFWTYHEPLAGELVPAEHAGALEQLHAGMRDVEFEAPRFTSRIEDAQRLVDDPSATPALGDADRDFLSSTLRDVKAAVLARGAPEQLLHGEPHPGNLLRTNDGLLFIDLETCVRGPVEFDLPYLPEDARALYRDADPVLLRQCEILMLAMVSAWRWDKNDEYPGGLEMGVEYLERTRLAMA